MSKEMTELDKRLEALKRPLSLGSFDGRGFPNFDYKKFTSILKQKGISIGELSELTEIGPMKLDRYLSGGEKPSETVICNLASAILMRYIDFVIPDQSLVRECPTRGRRRKSRLSDDDVRMIRKLYKNGEKSISEIAENFNIGKVYASEIARGKASHAVI